MPRSVSRRRLATVGALLVAAIAGAVGLSIDLQRTASIDDYQRVMAQFADAMALQTARSITLVDRAVAVVRAQLTAVQTTVPGVASAPPDTAAALDSLVDGQKLRSVDALAAFDLSGRMVSSSRLWSATVSNASGRDFFRYLSAVNDREAFIGMPERTDAQGSWTVVLARRIDDTSGRFAGLVAEQLSLADLEDFYRFAAPPGRTILVLRRDGTILASYPHQEDRIGNKLPDHAVWYRLVAQGGGTYHGPSALSGTPIISAVYPLRGLPIVVEVTTGEAEALAGWYPQRARMVLGGIAAAVCVILLLRQIGAQIRRLETSETSLAAGNSELKTARRQLDATLSNMTQGVCFFGGDQKLIVCNRRFAQIYNLPLGAIRPGMSLAEIVDHRFAAGTVPNCGRAEYLASHDALVRGGKTRNFVVELKNGRTIALHYQPMPDSGWVATHEDITERRNTDARIAYLARHDALTGLANRVLFQEWMEQALASTERGFEFAVLFLDLDRFKAVNDTLGHRVGDDLLRSVAARLLDSVRNMDTVTRLGGDEFVILQAGLVTLDDAARLAERIIKVVGAPYTIGGHEVVIGVSIGVAVAPSDGSSAEDLLKNADLALYIAKGEGRGTFRFFEPEMDARIHNRRILERDLRNAVARGEFELHYQPIIDVQSGRVCAFEALLRWHHPIRGLVAPAELVAIAEECGLIGPIGRWVLNTACLQAISWPDDVHVAVNLSPVQFRGTHLVEVVTEALAASGLPAARLELEVTESVLLESSSTTLATLHQLRDLGLCIAMDDFGTGYSSLGYLQKFPFSKIKIDQSFIKDLTKGEHALFIVRAVVGLCHNLGIRTTAEGVETLDQLTILRAEGCTEVQGYLFGRPQHADQLAALIDGEAPLA
jgi:diguanylate cyclase (GGDEF)-like protein